MNRWIYVVFAVAIVAVATFLLLPQGSYVYANVRVEEKSLSVRECALRKLYPISLVSPEEDVSHGDRTIIMKIFYNNTELLTSKRCERTNIGTGNCVLLSATLPDNIPINAVLSIRTELFNSTGFLISQAETTLAYN